MCGIIGYVGGNPALPRLINGLKKLEYRGYDSAGISFFTEAGVVTVKAEGRIANTEALLQRGFPDAQSVCGVGHTRWATTGKPSDANAHPHRVGAVTVVHNGIIENYKALKKECEAAGRVFRSQTDTEVIAALADIVYAQCGDPVKTLHRVISRLEGSFAVAALFDDRENTVYGFRKDSPLIVAETEDGNYFASDFIAVKHATDTYRLPDEETVVELTAAGARYYTADGGTAPPAPIRVTDANRDDGKGDFPHFMLKEIFEVPDAIRNTCRDRVCEGLPAFDDEILGRLAASGRIYIVACGTALNAGKLGKGYIEKFARIPVSCELASELRYFPPLYDEGDSFIFISQSGETADTVASLRMLKERGIYTVALVNTPNSTIAREADGVLYTRAGTETAVASTKAYNAQSALLFLLALGLGLQKGSITEKTAAKLTADLTRGVPAAVEKILADAEKIRAFSEKYCTAPSCFFLGRGPDFCLAEESSLKLKEISYIHCEAYAAGEIKHGTIALIEKDVPVIAIISGDKIRSKTINNAFEVKARDAKVLTVTDRRVPGEEETADDIYVVDSPDESLFHIPAATFFQLFAYYTALGRGRDVDKPRNLAKSVTVE
ncbi:MAG: glutamine--fructose-6-phosphate transaminase (isomerizing) [Clostridia bacterium]|nr:glutamine--fructose-6-phosphate transaminase (isomerizing) [Clostridia bacterium]